MEANKTHRSQKQPLNHLHRWCFALTCWIYSAQISCLSLQKWRIYMGYFRRDFTDSLQICLHRYGCLTAWPFFFFLVNLLHLQPAAMVERASANRRSSNYGHLIWSAADRQRDTLEAWKTALVAGWLSDGTGPWQSQGHVKAQRSAQGSV